MLSSVASPGQCLCSVVLLATEQQYVVVPVLRHRQHIDRIAASASNIAPPTESVSVRQEASPIGEPGTARPYLRGSTWWIKYYVPCEKKPRRESSESSNKKDAIRLLNTRRKEIDDRKVSSTSATVGDLLTLYLSDQKRQKRHSYNSAEGFVRLHLEPAFGPIKASVLQTKHIKAFIEQKQAAEYANASINRWLEALRRSFSLALEELPPLVYTAPNIESLMLEEENVREGFLEHDQYVILRNELPDHQRLILVIGYHLGMRRGEILNLRWDQVEWTENLIRLEKRQTKGKKARIAPLYGELRVWLDMAYTAHDQRVPSLCPGRGNASARSKQRGKKPAFAPRFPSCWCTIYGGLPPET